LTFDPDGLRNRSVRLSFMPRATKNPQAEFAKLLAAACVRRGYLEKLHAGATPVTWMGDFSDVRMGALPAPRWAEDSTTLF
jgi:hypothetical protein